MVDLHRYSARLAEALRAGTKKGLMSSLTMGTFWLLVYCIYAVIFWLGAKLVWEENLEPGFILQVPPHVLSLYILFLCQFCSPRFYFAGNGWSYGWISGP